MVEPLLRRHRRQSDRRIRVWSATDTRIRIGSIQQNDRLSLFCSIRGTTAIDCRTKEPVCPSQSSCPVG